MKLLRQAGSNSFFGNSVYIFLIRFFPSLAAILVMIWYSRQLHPADYGAYQNFWIQLYLLSAVACMGLQAFILTYPPAFMAGLIRRTGKLFFIGFLCWIILTGGVFAFLQSQGAGLPVYISMAFLVIYSLSVISESFLTLFRKFGLLFWVNLAYTALFCLIHWSMLGKAFQLERLFTMLLLLVIIKTCVFIVMSARKIREIPATDPVEDHNVQSAATIRSLWLHLGLYDISQMLFRWLDKFIISLVLSAELSAVYFNGSNDIPFLSLLLGAVGSASLIHLSAEKNQNDPNYSRKLTNQSSRILSAIVFPLFFFFLVFRYELFLVLFSDKYLASVPVFMFSLMIIPLRAYNWTAILQNRHKGAIINKGAALDLVLALAFMYPFYHWMGLAGVALSFVLSGYFQGWYYLHHISRLLNTTMSRVIPLWNWILKLAVLGAVFFTFHHFIAGRYSERTILAAGGGLLLVTMGSVLWIELKVAGRKA